ncbi:hypothetical protein [Streptomyces sp. LN549]|uniref:hypothetical protein n=1 Tax=Streptomyces sp. LN549 TaxID=3112979 RepID=UPI003711B8A5
MARRRSITRTCATTGCRETSFVEYTARRDIADLPAKWQCYRHSKPNEVLSADNPETHTTLALHPSYITGYDRNDPPKLIGHFWGPADAEKGNHGIVQGPGFRAIAADYPPGTRLIITARLELPAAEESTR